MTHFARVSDAPSEGVYIVCGVVIAMILVAAIIVLLAVFIRSVSHYCTPTLLTELHKYVAHYSINFQ